ncbi:hypothetical protein ATCC19435_1265 [Lactococcus lactis subsp. lactis]|nr:hypothetical protein ATCC19435_1265 [Lactococcus lactis subsp. lactis]
MMEVKGFLDLKVLTEKRNIHISHTQIVPMVKQAFQLLILIVPISGCMLILTSMIQPLRAITHGRLLKERMERKGHRANLGQTVRHRIFTQHGLTAQTVRTVSQLFIRI